MKWLWLLLLPVGVFADTSDNLLDTTINTNNVAYYPNAGVYHFSYTTGTVTSTGVLPEYDPLNILTLNWSFDAKMDCNNSIGGYCSNPNGPDDRLQAWLGVGNSGQYTDTRQVLDIYDYHTGWVQYEGSETYANTTQAYDSVKFEIKGIDSGYWAGYYGPKVKNPTVIAIYTPIPTGPDCSNPLNDPSCEGYWGAVAASTVTDEFTDTVFGDEIEDFYTAQEDVSTYEPDVSGDYEEEVFDEPVDLYTEVEMFDEPEEYIEELFDEPVFFDEPEELFDESVDIVETEGYEEVVEVEESLELEEVETQEVVSAVDVQKIALALAASTTTSTVSDTSDTFEQVAVEIVPNPTQAQEQSQEETPVPTQELVPTADMQFEQDFNDAIGAGQSIGQFLSAQLPDFSRFDVAPPSQQEQRTTQRATQALQTMSQQDIAQSTEAQLEEMQDSGGFSDQSLTVLLISNNQDFNQYNNITLDDRSQFYENRIIYRGNFPTDNSRALLRGSGTRTYEAMVDGQWQR